MNDFINKMGEYWSQLSFDKLGDILTYHHNAPILFSSGLFFFLFIGFLIIYMSLRKHLLTRIIYVTLFSIYFYYKQDPLRIEYTGSYLPCMHYCTHQALH